MSYGRSFLKIVNRFLLKVNLIELLWEKCYS